MVEWCLVHSRFLVGIHRLHQVDLDLEGPGADRADVLVHVLTGAFERAGDFQAEQLDPELAQPALVGPANGDLLDTEDFERTLVHHLALSSLN